MHVVLLKAPVRYPVGALVPSVSIPLGLISVAAALERDGCVVEVDDAQIDLARPLRSLPEGGLHLGEDWSAIEGRLRDRAPQVIGVECQAFAQHRNSLRAAAVARAACPEALIIGGGPAASISPQLFLSPDGPFDAIAIGEGEVTMQEVVRCQRQGADWRGVAGLAWRDGRGVQINPPRPLIEDLDTLPFPAFHLLDLESYFRLTRSGLIAWWLPLFPGSERTVPILTSRGCPYTCTFCFIPRLCGRRWRAHSPAYVQRQIKWLQDSFDVRHLHLHDDCISIDRSRFLSLIQTFRDLERPISWDLPSGTRLDDLDAELIQTCRDAGCIYTLLPVESGNPRVLNRVIKKRLKLSTALEVARLCHDSGLDAKSFFVIGFPSETWREFWDTISLATRLLLKYDVEAILQFASPWPGTALEAMCREQGLLPEGFDDDEMARLPLGKARRYRQLHPWWMRHLQHLHKQFQRGVMVIKGIAFYAPQPALSLHLMRYLFEHRQEQPLLETLRGFVSFKQFFKNRSHLSSERGWRARDLAAAPARVQ